MTKKLILSAFALCVSLVAACGSQGEGERCSVGASDCASGLVCTKAALLQGQTQDICCPSDLSKASSNACKGVSVFQPEPPVDAAATVDANVADSATDSGSADGSSGTADAADAQ